MFTGLIESIGTVSKISPKGNYVELTIAPGTPFENLVHGESIAVAGTCLTVTAFDNTSFTAEASQETTRLTTIGKLKRGDRVNLERALRADGRLGGHIVAGHVDCTSKVMATRKVGQSLQISVGLPKEFAAYIIDKGSVALDGVSLTVIEVDKTKFTINLIPESQQRTTLPDLKPGDVLNVEFDLIGKYILRSAQLGNPKATLSIEALRNMGY
ncbi:MAG: riboflavin synthase [Candidatus Zixiibacteriota bacterium]